MIRGLVLFDYDGTLVDEREKIYTPTKLTKRTIERLQNEGYLCMLATGRALSYIPNAARDLHLDGYITCNGAYVTVHGKEIVKDVFEDNELLKLLSYFEQLHINFILESNEFCFVKDLQDEEYLHFIDNYKIPIDNFVLFKGFEQVKGKISKITLIFHDRNDLQSVAKVLEEYMQVTLHRNCKTFDIGKKCVNKGSGIQAVTNYYHIPKADTYAFGDDINDMEMIRTVKYGIVMGVHHKKLDEVCFMVTDNVKDEGIYHACITLGMLKQEDIC